MTLGFITIQKSAGIPDFLQILRDCVDIESGSGHLGMYWRVGDIRNTMVNPLC